ncbi:MAG TPA: hypothetical protein VL098_08620 [Flavipsychrobacter sp.]|nr:hypothetical protein [Flavipsychrobacter sp.]
MIRFYKIKAWLLYRLKAKSRHGVHSPFAYHFSEQVLYRKDRKQLRSRLVAYFEGWKLTWNKKQIEGATVDTVIIIEAVHDRAEHYEEWKRLSADPRVTLSIDIFDYGILLFRADFLQKQHFILK